MKKIPNVFSRDESGRSITTTPNPLSQWVLDGEGLATRKWDGTACLVRDGRLFKRYDAKRGKTPPLGFEECCPPDPVTGHWPGWIAVGNEPSDRWFHDVLRDVVEYCCDGTYELCGPRIGTNPERFRGHVLIAHGSHVLHDVYLPRTFDSLRTYLLAADIEGIVFHHADGRMAKIRKTDFGGKR